MLKKLAPYTFPIIAMVIFLVQQSNGSTVGAFREAGYFLYKANLIAYGIIIIGSALLSLVLLPLLIKLLNAGALKEMDTEKLVDIANRTRKIFSPQLLLKMLVVDIQRIVGGWAIYKSTLLAQNMSELNITYLALGVMFVCSGYLVPWSRILKTLPKEAK
ncbi:hypothetical protein COT97_03975 [Candidatus Falkowbacteria bacterium CG10_big_fil_rev_8_21_14_0_10_39_11]|uniref:Uncharacterized protein n=1 Tax=Candidatus Falkowbacteria bacterium CG10_big_fil_rev_8_21_14_0_10_39_11 TaxID=1974565 RepID=A0A2H0V4C9_9BACT|nr:MAG: hypothetical protein COT97_03975 [Candidatus Falkowbacteria bacterium CG10_big_fil_rev_8_21_14_0_10_39_11]